MYCRVVGPLNVGSRGAVPNEPSGQPGNIFMFPFSFLHLVYLLNECPGNKNCIFLAWNPSVRKDTPGRCQHQFAGQVRVSALTGSAWIISLNPFSVLREAKGAGEYLSGEFMWVPPCLPISRRPHRCCLPCHGTVLLRVLHSQLGWNRIWGNLQVQI